MSFFDQKEDVIEIQLTQYGKQMLSKGVFKPTFYAFFDDDILYDQRYASGSAIETQKDIQDRILNETPRSKTQYLFHSVDQLGELNELQRTNLSEYTEKIQQVPEKHYAAVAPLGNSYLIGDKAPAFDIKLFKGSISGSVTTISGTTQHVHSTQRIPQINLNDVIFYTSVKDGSGEGSIGIDDHQDFFDDETYIAVEEDFLLLEIKEENVPLAKENFDIEVYITDQSGNIEVPLYFIEEIQAVRNGILLDEPIRPRSSEIDVDNVKYYFKLKADRNIGSATALELLDPEE